MKILGMGLVTGLGLTAADTYRAMCEGKCVFRDLTRFDAAPYAQKRGGQLSDEVEDALRTEYPDDDLCLAMIKHAGGEALAGVPAGDGPLGLVLATNFGPMETLEWAWRERLDTGTLDDESYRQYDAVLECIGDVFGCDGPRVQISMSCASGASGVCAAKDLIASGRASRVLVVAYDMLSEFCWCGLSNLRTITTDVMRPFDASRSGTIFSEGAAAMLLGSTDDGGNAVAYVAGCATNNNAFHLTAPCKRGEGSEAVIREALRQAGLAPSDIGHVCAHATSTHANDETEAAALHAIFGTERFTDGTLTVSAHKSQLGHLLGAAGLAEAIITVLAMTGGIVPPTLNHQSLDPACAPIDCIPGRARRVAFDAAVTNSAGIGGNNSALVLTRRPTVGRTRTPRKMYLRRLAWVLPASIGSGRELLDHPEWVAPTEDMGKLADFSLKDYVQTVKGYQDAGSGYLMAALSMVCGEETTGNRCGICTASRYGCCTSAYAFFEQMVKKGPRLASPLIFPHGYVNTPGNLAAIDLRCSGPHMVFSSKVDYMELLRFAAERFADDTADTMLLGFYEATVPQALPDGHVPLRGAVAACVSATPSPEDICEITSF